MFPPQFFAPTFFAPTYWPDVVGAPTLPAPGGVYFAPSYSAPTYFAPAYFPGGSGVAPPSLDLRASLVAALKADATVAAVAGAQVYPLTLPERKNPPAVLYHVEDQDRRESLDGPTGSAEARARVGCGSKAGFADCAPLAAAVRRLLDGLTGRLGGSGGVYVEACVSAGEHDHYDPPDDGSDRGTYWTVLDYLILYRES
jgi:hypothetical protein